MLLDTTDNDYDSQNGASLKAQKSLRHTLDCIGHVQNLKNICNWLNLNVCLNERN